MKRKKQYLKKKKILFALLAKILRGQAAKVIHQWAVLKAHIVLLEVLVYYNLNSFHIFFILALTYLIQSAKRDLNIG